MESGAKVKRERTCIACGAKAGKMQLLRIVRCPDGAVRFDSRGNMAGRGAYVCSRDCLEKALTGGKLQRALRVSLSREEERQVASDIEAACAAGE